MQVADVSEWMKVVGKTVRVKKEKEWNGKILGIGHIVKDIWFIPSEEFKEAEEKK